MSEKIFTIRQNYLKIGEQWDNVKLDMFVYLQRGKCLNCLQYIAALHMGFIQILARRVYHSAFHHSTCNCKNEGFNLSHCFKGQAGSMTKQRCLIHRGQETVQRLVPETMFCSRNQIWPPGQTSMSHPDILRSALPVPQGAAIAIKLTQ